MRQVPSSDGQTLAVHDLGGEGRPTLLCHATGFHAAVWEPLAAALGPGLDRWAVDFRAHGASVLAEGAELAWPAFGDDVLAVIDGLGLVPGTILGVGHSMGGAALVLAEEARPGLFAGLWLFEPVVAPPGVLSEGPGGANPLAAGAAKRRPSFPSHDAALANYAAKPPLNVLRADALHAYVRHGFTTGEDGQAHLACRPEHEAQIFSGGGAHGAFAGLDSVRCPVVIARGVDEWGPAMFADHVVAALPNGRLELHDHVGHFGPLEAPAEMAAAIDAFAAGL